MSFIQDIYHQHIVQSESETKGTFFSVLNYIIANSDNAEIRKKDIEDRFMLRKSYSDILTHLKDQKVISEEDSSIVVNIDAKNYLKPILQNVLAKSYSAKYGQLANDDLENSPEVSILLDCRSELYKAH